MANAWFLRAMAATLVLGGLTQLGTAPVVSQPATPVASLGADRISVDANTRIRLARHAPSPVRSLLNVRHRMHYGQAIWNEFGVPAGQVWVHVDRRSQIVSVFRGGHEIGTAVILYGAPEKPTPAGLYPVLGKKLHHRSAAYGAPMPYTMWLTRDGVAIHASDVREGAATHGCIGVPREFARKLFDAIRPGDPVVIA